MTVKLMKFGAEWCMPCKKMDPIVHKFKELGLCEVETIDVDENPELASEYEIRGIPAFVWLKNGTKVSFHAGTCTLGVLKSNYEQALTGKIISAEDQEANKA